jgi:hypothetical protein
MTKRRKQLVKSWTLGAIPSAPVKILNPNYEDSRTLISRLRREEDEAREAPVKAAISQLNETLLELRAAQRDALFKIPSEELAAMTTASPANIEGTVDELRTQIRSAFDAAKTELARRIRVPRLCPATLLAHSKPARLAPF